MYVATGPDSFRPTARANPGCDSVQISTFGVGFKGLGRDWRYEDEGNLSVGFGANDGEIGPEFQFGHVIGDHCDNQVLLIKTAWGGKSLSVDFRPPSSGKTSSLWDARRKASIEENPDAVGKFYRDMLAEVREVLNNVEKLFPDYDGRGYEIAGFCWHQGWNDGCDDGFSKEYGKNLLNFIRDVRNDLGKPDLPFVIASSGFGGSEPRRGVVGRLQQWVIPAQVAAAKKLDRVACVNTQEFYRPEEASPGRGDIEHWFCNAESFFLIGDAMGRAMNELLER